MSTSALTTQLIASSRPVSSTGTLATVRVPESGAASVLLPKNRGKTMITFTTAATRKRAPVAMPNPMRKPAATTTRMTASCTR